MDASDASLRPLKRLKIPSPQTASISKGKEKMPGEPPAPGSGGFPPSDSDETCGICLSDSGRYARGRIDSCDHYFCFICIMEWAKVESKCPLCKQRFGSIYRPPSRGVSASERTVFVPARDQVYHPLGNQSRTLSDPYANTVCSECQTSANGEFLLLCDLCDTGSHTYCIGLGYTVPDGDWFCSDCSISKKEHSKAESDSDIGSEYSDRNLSESRVSGPPVSITEIVSDEIVSDSSRRPLTSDVCEQQRNDGITPQRRNTCSQMESQDSLQSASTAILVGETVSSNLSHGSNRGSRTLHHCRNLQDRIRVLRENWNELRSGSIDFTSSLFGNNDKNNDGNQRCNAANNNMAEQSEQLSSTNREQNAVVNASTDNYTKPQDIRKAWKMMKIAKSVQGARRGSVSSSVAKIAPTAGVSSSSQTQKTTGLGGDGKSCKMMGTTKPVTLSQSGSISSHSLNYANRKTISKGAGNSRCGSLISKGNASVYKVATHADSKDHMCLSSKSVQEQHRTISIERKKPDVQKMELQHFHIGHPKTGLPDYFELSRKEDDFSFRNLCGGKHGSTPQKFFDKVFSANNRPDGRQSQGSAACSPSGVSILSAMKSVELPNNGEEGVGSKDDGSLIRRNGIASNGAKGEVQSLVKLNLKLLSRDQHLDADRFKDVARIATHSILAACGLEHSKSSARVFSTQVCRHTEKVEELRKSNLMPKSCRECFFSFVKDVVNSILSEKIFRANTC